MDQITQSLGRTIGIHTAQVGLLCLTDNRHAARRANRRQTIRCSTTVGCHTHHFGNDVTSLAHHNRITNGQLLFIDKVLVVQSRAANRGTGQCYRIKHARGSQHTGATHVNFHVTQNRLFLLGRILISDCPFREFTSRTKGFSVCKAIHLHNRSVDVKGQTGASIADFTNKINDFIDRIRHAVEGNHGKAQSFDPFQRIGVRMQDFSFDELHIKHEQRQVSLCHHRRILLS